jgi:hypothetical protein
MRNRRVGNAATLVIAALLGTTFVARDGLAAQPQTPEDIAASEASAADDASESESTPANELAPAPTPVDTPEPAAAEEADGLLQPRAASTNRVWIDRAAHAELLALRAESLDTRRQLQTSVLTSGLVSIVAGVALAIPNDYDQGLRYAGFNTLGFGVINTIVGGVALYGINKEETDWESGAVEPSPQSPEDYRRYRDHALADESREAWGHGINLGLAGAYAAIGGMAIVVSQLDVDHPNRWLGSGVAIAAQAVHLAVVDLVGSAKAREFEERMREIAPAVSYDPANGNSVAGATYQAQF